MTDRIGHPAQVTLSLVAYAAVLIVVFGIGSGLLGALRPGPVDATSVNRARAYSTETLPLETAIEREPVLSRHPRFIAEAGQHLARMLLSIGGAAVRDAVLKAYPLTLPAPTDAGTDTYGNEWYLLAQGRVIDAVRFAASLTPP